MITSAIVDYVIMATRYTLNPHTMRTLPVPVGKCYTQNTYLSRSQNKIKFQK